MNASQDSEARSLKSKTSFPSPNAAPTTHAPTRFVLRSETEMEKSMAASEDTMEQSSHSFNGDEPIAASTASTSFGVQSLEDVMQISEDSLSASPRTTVSVLAGMKRKPGNPVHPKIYATGQRIVSNDLSSSMISTLSTSPTRTHARRSSVSSSAHLTPLHVSPHADIAEPGTPRTNSMKSFKLSDEEASVTSDTPSQAIQSSSSEDDAIIQQSTSMASGAHRESELVMPSLAVPMRRPFTERGRNLGQMKITVAGRKGLGKTSLLRSIFKHCDDIVHVDGISNGTSATSTADSRASALTSTTSFVEYQASTKPYPMWWSDVESSRSWWRRKSVGEGVLERNIRFVDTPGVSDAAATRSLLDEVDHGFLRLLALDSVSDTHLLELLSGRTDGIQDVVLYMFSSEQEALGKDEISLLQELSKRTNLVPVLAQADKLDMEKISVDKQRLLELLNAARIDFCSVSSISDNDQPRATSPSSQDIFAVSSLVDDSDVLDASTLMASDYLPPLSSSDLPNLISALFEPATAAQLRHQALIKFIRWRREHTKRSGPQQSLLRLPQTHTTTSTGSLLDEPSKVLVPDIYSSYYRSTSPSGSDSSDLVFGAHTSPVNRPTHILSTVEPSRHLHIAKWARDLRRSLRMDGNHADLSARPAKGRLGGELGIIDPKDPLGLSSLGQALGRNSWLTLQILGGCGLISAAVWWMSRNWIELQEWLWPSYASPLVIGAPQRSWLESFRLL